VHPGSLHLRIGKADSSKPIEVLHVIARLKARASSTCTSTTARHSETFVVDSQSRRIVPVATPADVQVSARCLETPVDSAVRLIL
jgi:hypothetical protein